jgi:hypothetical protein
MVHQWEQRSIDDTREMGAGFTVSIMKMRCKPLISA